MEARCSANADRTRTFRRFSFVSFTRWFRGTEGGFHRCCFRVGLHTRSVPREAERQAKVACPEIPAVRGKVEGGGGVAIISAISIVAPSVSVAADAGTSTLDNSCCLKGRRMGDMSSMRGRDSLSASCAKSTRGSLQRKQGITWDQMNGQVPKCTAFAK